VVIRASRREAKGHANFHSTLAALLLLGSQRSGRQGTHLISRQSESHGAEHQRTPLLSMLFLWYSCLRSRSERTYELSLYLTALLLLGSQRSGRQGTHLISRQSESHGAEHHQTPLLGTSVILRPARATADFDEILSDQLPRCRGRTQDRPYPSEG